MQSKLSAWTQYNLGCNNTKRWTIKSLVPTHTYPVCFVIKFKGNFTTKPLWEGGVERWSFLSSLRMLLCPAEHRLASGAFWTRWSWRSSPTLMIPKPTSPCNRGNDVARPEEDKARQLNPLGHSPRPHQGQLSPRGAAHLFSAPRGTARHGTRDVPRWAPWMQLARRRFARRWRFPVLHLVLCLEHGCFGSSALSETYSCCLHEYSLHSAAYR